MNEWLTEELAEVQRKKADKQAKQERADLIQEQTKVLWNNLKPVLKDAVDQMNAEGSEFRKMIGGLGLSDSDNIVTIRKISKPPSVELQVSRNPNSVSWLYKVVERINATTTKERGHTTLQVELDDDRRPYLQQGDTPVELEDAVRQILRPFIHPELLE